MSLAQYIDHTILKPTTTEEEIKKLCSEAIQFSFAAVCVPPYFVSKAAGLLHATTIKTATVIGFPFGYNHYSAKALETEKAIEDGANEIDMVMNISAFKNKDYDFPPEYGPLAATTPGTPGALCYMLANYGKLTLEEVLAPDRGEE